MMTPMPPAATHVRLALLTLSIAVMSACSGGDTTPFADFAGQTPPRSCITPSEGCPCSPEGQVVECGVTVKTRGAGVECASGTRTCAGGLWGGCATVSVTPGGPGLFSGVRPLELGSVSSCVGNPCDPYCSAFVDTPAGLDAGSALMVNEAGITITPAPRCNTTLTGEVRDPGSNVALSNVFVFLKQGPLAPFVDGPAADTCSTILTGGPSGGQPGVRTTTDAAGRFSLTLPQSVSESTAPFELVIQTGRWRRVFSMSNATPTCGSRAVGALRLPGNQVEGDIPQFAVVTAEADTTECLLLKMGIQASEFTHPSRSGRVHVYQNLAGDDTRTLIQGKGPQLSAAAPHYGPAPEAAVLHGSPTELARHSILVLPCQGSTKPLAINSSKYPSATHVANVRAFADAGGRIFATHYSDAYIRHDSSGNVYGSVANWSPSLFTSAGSLALREANINLAQPRAVAFQSWLQQVGGLNAAGRLVFKDANKRSLSALSPSAETWLTNHNPSGSASEALIHHLTFDTPVGAPAAGRVVYLSSHIGPIGDRRFYPPASAAQYTFPAECRTGALTPSELSLEYMLFDLSACVGAPPPPPAPLFTPTNFSRDFTAQCGPGERIRWRKFGFGSITPSDTRLTFSAQTADTAAGLDTATGYTIYTAQGAPNPLYSPGAPNGGVVIDGTPEATVIPSLGSRAFLRINASFSPSSDGQSAPTLTGWRQLFACEPAE